MVALHGLEPLMNKKQLDLKKLEALTWIPMDEYGLEQE
jgi:hypothetical protein